jgi:hypothetical protein
MAVLKSLVDSPRSEPTKSEALFEFAAGGKFDGLGSRNFDFFTRLRIDPGASFAVHNLEGAEADQLDNFGFLNATLDAFDHSSQSAFCGSFAGFATEFFLDFFYELSTIYGHNNLVPFGCSDVFKRGPHT